MILLLLACDKMDFKLHLTNQSGKNLYYQVKLDSILVEGLLIESLPNNDTLKVGTIGGEGTWEYKIKQRSIDSTLYVFIFFDQELTNEVIRNRNYRMKGFKVKDLDKLNWIIAYPNDFD